MSENETKTEEAVETIDEKKPAGKSSALDTAKDKVKSFVDVEDNGEKRRISIGWLTCFRIGVTVLLIFICMYYLGPIENFLNLFLGGCLAIFAGFIIAYIVNIPMRFFEHHLPGPTGDGTKNRTISLILAYISILAVVVVLLLLVIPNLISAIIVLSESAPAFIDDLSENAFVTSIIPPEMIEQVKAIDWDKTVKDTVAWLQTGVMDSLPQILGAVGKIIACFMGIVLSFWFLGEKDALCAGAHRLVKTYIGGGADEWIRKGSKYADDSFHGFIVGAALEGVLFGTIVAIGCAIAGIPEALMLGALVGVMSLIPVVGALIGAILGAIIICAVSWQKALIFLVLFFAIQQVEQNFLYPRVVGRRAGLTGMWPLIGTMLGMAVFGFLGVFVGVPLVATVLRIVNADMNRREKLGDEATTLAGKMKMSMRE